MRLPGSTFGEPHLLFSERRGFLAQFIVSAHDSLSVVADI